MSRHVIRELWHGSASVNSEHPTRGAAGRTDACSYEVLVVEGGGTSYLNQADMLKYVEEQWGNWHHGEEL